MALEWNHAKPQTGEQLTDLGSALTHVNTLYRVVKRWNEDDGEHGGANPEIRSFLIGKEDINRLVDKLRFLAEWIEREQARAGVSGRKT